MLVLTRKKDEGIVIGGNVTIKVLAVEDGRIKLGIDAPKDVEILREEVYIQIKEENSSAIQIDLDILKDLK